MPPRTGVAAPTPGRNRTCVRHAGEGWRHAEPRPGGPRGTVIPAADAISSVAFRIAKPAAAGAVAEAPPRRVCAAVADVVRFGDAQRRVRGGRLGLLEGVLDV